MERRRALVIAGTLAATVTMAGSALAVNLGLLGTSEAEVGNLDATEIQASDGGPSQPKPQVRVIVQDVPVSGGTASPPATSYEDHDDVEYEDHDGEDEPEHEDEDEVEDDHEDDD
jgi:hypothetical protein